MMAIDMLGRTPTDDYSPVCSEADVEGRTSPRNQDRRVFVFSDGGGGNKADGG